MPSLTINEIISVYRFHKRSAVRVGYHRDNAKDHNEGQSFAWEPDLRLIVAVHRTVRLDKALHETRLPGDLRLNVALQRRESRALLGKKSGRARGAKAHRGSQFSARSASHRAMLA